MTTKHLSSQIEQIFATDEQNSDFTLEQFLSHINTKSFGVLLVITALPIALPFTPPGFSIPFGLMCIFLSIQMLLGRTNPWFPKWLLNKKIGSSSSKLTLLMIKWLKWFENFLRPRLSFLVSSQLSKTILAVLILFCSVVMLVPLPLVNSISALPVFFLGISLVEEDGLFSLFGVFCSLLLMALCVATAWFGVGILDVIKDWIKTTLLGR
jgi:hypothetical protein